MLLNTLHTSVHRLNIVAATTVAIAAAAAATAQNCNFYNGAESALWFNGVNSHVVVPGSSDVTYNNITVEAWIRADTIDEPVMRIVSTAHSNPQGGIGHGPGFGLGVLQSGRLRFTRFNVHDHDTVHSYIEPHVWTHVAVVYSPSIGAAFYVNGQPVETLPHVVPYSPWGADITIGRNPSVYSEPEPWHGALDEVRVWNNARTADQIQEFYQTPVSPQPGLIGFWRFSEGEGTQAKNSASGIDGVVKDAVWIKPTAPTIVASPVNTIVMSGKPVALSVAATQADAYQWYKDGQPILNDARISGAKSSTLKIAPVEPGDFGVYQVVALNPCSSATSGSAAVSVLPAPSTCPADLNGDGAVGISDLLQLLASWGPCP